MHARMGGGRIQVRVRRRRGRGPSGRGQRIGIESLILFGIRTNVSIPSLCQAKVLGVPTTKKREAIPMVIWHTAYEYFAVAASITGLWSYHSAHSHKMVRALAHYNCHDYIYKAPSPLNVVTIMGPAFVLHSFRVVQACLQIARQSR